MTNFVHEQMQRLERAEWIKVKTTRIESKEMIQADSNEE